MSRQTFPIVFGGGLDRASGTAITSPASLEVAENVVLHRGRVSARTGMGEVRSSLGGATYVAGGHSDRNTLRAVVVAAFGTPGASSHRLEIWAATGSGRDAYKLGDWANPCESVEKARVIACQSGPYVILAHDEPSIDRRAPTVAVDLEAGTITELTAAWAGGDTKLRFRGVTAWLEYVVGWAFGTNLVDKPHMARVSDIAAPLTFQEDAWETFGQAGDPILACFPGQVGRGGALVVRKQTDTFVLTGYDFSTFGQSQVEILHGLAASRLTVTDGATEWLWSLEGPREAAGGVSRDIGEELGLHPWPTMEDIAAAGRIDAGFAVYQPGDALVHFVFHDWVYTYNLATKGWNHAVLGSPVHCGFILYARTGYEGASRGYPDFVSAVAADADSYTITWDDISPEGDETVEVWMRRQGNAWGASPTETASISLAPTVVIDGVYSGTYEVSIRYKRDGLYSGAGDVSGQPAYDYTGAPDTWPAVSRGSFVVATATPTISALVWSRTSASTERIAVTYAGSYPVQILRNTVDDAGTATLLTTGTTGGTYNDDAPGTGETTVYYYARHLFPDTTTGTPSAAYPIWIGPTAPANLHLEPVDIVTGADYYAYTLAWNTPASGATTDVQDDYHCLNTFVSRGTSAADATFRAQTVEKSSPGSQDGTEVILACVGRARHNVTTFGVADTSDWATVDVDILLEPGEPEFRSCT